MSVIAGASKGRRRKGAYGDEARRGRVFPKTKWTLVVMAVALLALVAFAALIAASQAPNAEHYSRQQVRTLSRERQRRRFPSLGRRLR